MTPARRDAWETVAGGVVAILLLAVTSWVFSRQDLGTAGTYEVTARFGKADGLNVGSEVRAAGVPVGDVTALQLDNDQRAVVTLRIDDTVVLDLDATASIVTDGLFGPKFVRLDIGAADALIEPGGEIVFTEEAVIVDDLLQLIIERGRARQAREQTALVD